MEHINRPHYTFSTLKSKNKFKKLKKFMGKKNIFTLNVEIGAKE